VSTPTREHPVSEGLPTLVADPLPVAHAFGKLAALSENDCGLMLTCHQLTRSGEEAARAACTNATAAAAAWVGLHSGERADSPARNIGGSARQAARFAVGSPGNMNDA